MNIREKFEKETGVPAYISTGVGSTRPTHHYAEWLEEQLRIATVVGQSEQLFDFIQWRKQVSIDDLKDKEMVEFYLARKVK